jgi:hypothetical protein
MSNIKLWYVSNMVISCNIDMCIMHVCIIYIYYNMYTSTFRGVVLCMFSGKFSRGMLIVPFNRERWLEASWTKTSWFLDFHTFDFFPSIFDPWSMFPFRGLWLSFEVTSWSRSFCSPEHPGLWARGEEIQKVGGRPSWVVFISSWLVNKHEKTWLFQCIKQ